MLGPRGIRLIARTCSTAQWRGFSAATNTNAAKAAAKAINTTTVVEPTKSSNPNGIQNFDPSNGFPSIGRYYNYIQFVSRKENTHKLTGKALYDLYKMVKGPEDGKFVINMTKYYQEKGMDFNELLGSNFVSAAILGGKSKEAAELCAKYSNRMGAWLSPKPLHSLVEALLQNNTELEVCVNMLETASKKGVVARVDTFDQVLSSAMNHENASEFHSKLLVAAEKMLGAEDLKQLKAKFPLVISSEEAKPAQDI